MSRVVIQGDASGTGDFTIAAPNSNTDRTLTLPDEAGTVLTSVSDLAGLTGVPAAGTALFSAKFTTSAWGAAAAGAVIPFDAENFDTDGVYSTTTYAFTAPANGVYLFWFSIYTANTDTTNGFCLYKNNALLNFQSAATGYLSFISGTQDDHIQTASVVVALNSSDTIQVRAAGASDYYTGHAQWGGVRLS
jgi:hypothetical protein